MSSTNGWDSNGRFAKENRGGPGQPKGEAKENYLACLSEVCSVDRWRMICRRAVKDADAGDHRAREWLFKILIGDAPTVSVNLATDAGSVRVLEYDDWYE